MKSVIIILRSERQRDGDILFSGSTTPQGGNERATKRKEKLKKKKKR
jgi:hypothetical protein